MQHQIQILILRAAVLTLTALPWLPDLENVLEEEISTVEQKNSWDQEQIASLEPGDVPDVSQMLTVTEEDADRISVFKNFIYPADNLNNE